jgi:energy-coupling factor transporter transmembrane protein EcfT
MTDKPSRRDLMRPVQLLGLAFLAAVFAGVVTLVTMGFFQSAGGDQQQRALVVAAIAAGVTFIAVLVVLALLLLAVDPAQVTRGVERPVLLPHEDAGDDDPAAPDDAAGDAAEGPARP